MRETWGLLLLLMILTGTRWLSGRVRRRAFDLLSQEQAWMIIAAFESHRSLIILYVVPLFVGISVTVLFSGWSNAEQAIGSAAIVLALHLPMLLVVHAKLVQVAAPPAFIRTFLASRLIVVVGSLLAVTSFAYVL